MALDAELAAKPYAHWVEDMVQELFNIDPDAISLQMRDADGQTYTCYWNCSRDDRTIMMDAMRDDGLLEFVRMNRDELLEILNGEEDDEDGLCESDTETDCEG